MLLRKLRNSFGKRPRAMLSPHHPSIVGREPTWDDREAAPSWNSRQAGEFFSGGRNDRARQFQERIEKLIQNKIIRRPLGLYDLTTALVALQSASAGLGLSRTIATACYRWNERLFPRPPGITGIPIEMAVNGLWRRGEAWQLTILVSAGLDTGSREIDAAIVPPDWETPSNYVLPAGSGPIMSTVLYLGTILQPIVAYLQQRHPATGQT
jgi:hypothetical protein